MLPVVVLLVAVLSMPVAASTDQAGTDDAADSDGVVTLAVFGDSLADGIWAGVYRTLRGDDRFEILRRARAASGLARPDFYDWHEALDRYLESDPIDVAIVSIGLNDGQPLFHDGQWAHDFASEPWDEIYAERVDRFMRQFEDAGVEVFWVGLPNVRSDSFRDRVAHLNEIFAQSADGRDVVFVPLWDATSDEGGAYSSYLSDASGRSRNMRANDGIHFTSRGYEMIGAILVDAMRQELPILEADAGDE